MPNPAENTGQASVEFELISPKTGPVALNAVSIAHVSSVVRDTVMGIGTHIHKFRTSAPDVVDKSIKQAMASSLARLRFRLGVGTPGQTAWLPWQNHCIVHYAAAVAGIGENSGHTLELHTMDALYLLTRSSVSAARKGSVSEIVSAMLDEFGFKDSVVEGTKKGPGAYIQVFEDHESFIRKRMLVRARNDKDRGNYQFYCKDNAVHFHTPDFQASVHNIVYHRSNAGSLALVDSSQKLISMGVAGTVVTSVDPRNGKTAVIGSDPSKCLRLADSIYQLDAIPGVKKNLFRHVGPGIPDENEVIGQNVYENARSSTFSLTLDVDRAVHIRHGDFINLVVSPSDNKVSPWSGVYQVRQAVHAVNKNAVRSSYVLVRGEIKKSLTNLTSVSSKDLLVIEQDAPGQQINLEEIKSSQRTKGTGNSSINGKLYTTVNDPN